MVEIILITGGARSGKSRHAQGLAETRSGSPLFIATSPTIDDEMRERIARHQSDRRGRGWRTVEETIQLKEALANNREEEVVLIDCLTLWISNLLFEAEEPELLGEDTIEELCREMLAEVRGRSGTVIFVTNEVGAGIVPENPLARRFRDLTGRCNQVMAAGANRVDLVTCGIAMTIKMASQTFPSPVS